MRIAFYAPMKPPTHPTPSGDRTLARALLGALNARLVSDLRVYDGLGDDGVQSDLFAKAAGECDRLCTELAGEIDIWVSYHNYYKAPDLLGPHVAARLGLPYVLIEASRARKRLNGPWARFANAAEAATDAAALVFYLTAQDHAALERDRPDHQCLLHLAPFLACDDLPAASQGTQILAAGMMRGADKLASYRLIAKTLRKYDQPFRLEIAGDGPAHAEVRAMMAPFGDQVRFVGALDGAQMAQAYARAGVLFWPGVNEAFGMVYLEAAAHGLAVLAQDRPGVRDVAPGGVDVATGPDGMAAALARLLNDAPFRATQALAGRARVAQTHLLGAARATLHTGLARVLA
ncbi:MAG: glycosyltransferase family 4 protein [Sedimentitalea sp.]